MHSFKELSAQFEEQFSQRHFPSQPSSLYDAAQYILGIGGKRIRPVLCLMANELFNPITEAAFHAATAIELFHNFTLIHDDIMDKAPLRRGQPTVHHRYNNASALLAGDVMLVQAYEYLNHVGKLFLSRILITFNQTAKEVCEGQQMDMDFEKLSLDEINMQAYLQMITLKTSVLLAASLKTGAILGGGSEGNANHLYEFGKNIGIAFQIQDDFLDAYGDPKKFGKQPGGDILTNKKTFLLLKAYELCDADQGKKLVALLNNNHPDKVKEVVQIFSDCKANKWARDEKEKYAHKALEHLEAVAVLSKRKQHLREFADYLLQREY